MRTSLLSLAWSRRLVAALFLNLAAAVTGFGATLASDAPMHTQATDASPVVGTLPANTSIHSLRRDELTAAGLEPPPPGWVVLRSSGPFTGFVLNRDVQSDGTIKIGAQIRQQPLTDAPLLLNVEEGDAATAREPLGDWSRATIYTELIVFVNAMPAGSRGQTAEMTPAAAPTGTAEADASAAAAAIDEVVIDTSTPAPPEMDEAPAPATPRRERTEPEIVETTGTPRTFVGYLMRTRRFLGRGPKYDYQLVDEQGRRICLLDLSGLLETSSIESFENRHISIYGPGITRSDVKDVIIRVQTLRLVR